MLTRLVFVLLGLAWAGAAQAQVEISGRVAHPGLISASELAQQPAVVVEVNYASEHGPQHIVFKGVLLWPLLTAAGVIDDVPRDRLQHVLLARGRDGYAVALAIGELNPMMEGKSVLIATEQDGVPLPAPRLVVPGDKHAGRGVRELAAIEVR